MGGSPSLVGLRVGPYVWMPVPLTPRRRPRRLRPLVLGAVAAVSCALLAPAALVAPAGAQAAAAPTGDPAAAPTGTTAAAATAAAAPAADLASRFTLVVLPDTQFYSRYSDAQFVPRYGTDPYRVQTEWLAEHRDELNVPFVAHLGDVVDQVGVPAQWAVADDAMSTLEEAGLPYSILPGNHDVLDSSDDRYDTSYDLAAEPYLQHFPASRATSQASVDSGTDPTGLSQFQVFEAEGQQFLVLALGWRSSDATLAWADQVLAEHPTLPTILTSHQIIDVDNDGVTAKDTEYGDRLWRDLIAPNDQVFLTLNGHFHGATRQVRVNDAGHDVTQVLMDYQMAYEGGNGYLGLFEFDLTAGTIQVQTASPWVVSKPEEALTSFDQPFQEGPQQQFVLDVDFADRFAGFAPAFSAGEPTRSSLSDAARRILLDGFEGAPPATTEAPGSVADYPLVDGTLAHWRPDAAQGVVSEGEAVADVAGGQDLHRASLAASGSATAQVGDVVASADADPLSSAGASMCFVDSDKSAGRFSYLTTDEGAPVNDAAFADGYTIETFLKVDADWSEDANAWAKAIVRSGNRSQIGVPETRWDWTASPAALGLSNLKELQWTEIPSDPAKGDRTAWSGEVVLDRWMHVALVNDPASATTTMYVDGAPVLRNTVDTAGQTVQQGMPWLFGSDWVDDRATNGWAGCIGETRVVDHPTEASQWLTARADLTGLTVGEPVLDAAGAVVAVGGSGLAGATVTLGGALGGSTVVAADGTWTVVPTGAGLAADAAGAPADAAGVSLAAAEQLVATATQSLGTRSAAPVEFRFAAAVEPVDPADPPVVDPGTGGALPGDGGAPGSGGTGSGGTGTGAGAGTAGGAGTDAATAGGTRDGLAWTGAELIGGALAAAGLLLAGLGAVVVARRRRGVVDAD